jgi:AbrB family looped-hinge helix DNA binding protein
VKQKKENVCCSIARNKAKASCKVESIISVDERGQMVLPKELRKKAQINAGDKLALTSWEKDGKVCCLTLIKVEDLVDMMKGQLGPVIREIL